MATIVRPIIIGDICAFFAMLDAESTNTSQNYTKNTTPTPRATKNKIIRKAIGQLAIESSIKLKNMFLPPFFEKKRPQYYQ
ncbi:MAG: hypothetical protein II833_07850 [Pseudobutyrivibrio sp.]|nr:hypothetical protein [Pseudobutyrivibrio sp.]